jgi:hypothetical protein
MRRPVVRWRRVCVDIGDDETVWSSSVEWHADHGDDNGPFAFTVLPVLEEVDAVRAFCLALAEPWYQPSLPFPTAGYIVDAASIPKDEIARIADRPRQ